MKIAVYTLRFVLPDTSATVDEVLFFNQTKRSMDQHYLLANLRGTEGTRLRMRLIKTPQTTNALYVQTNRHYRRPNYFSTPKFFILVFRFLFPWWCYQNSEHCEVILISNVQIRCLFAFIGITTGAFEGHSEAGHGLCDQQMRCLWLVYCQH